MGRTAQADCSGVQTMHEEMKERAHDGRHTAANGALGGVVAAWRRLVDLPLQDGRDNHDHHAEEVA